MHCSPPPAFDHYTTTKATARPPPLWHTHTHTQPSLRFLNLRGCVFGKASQTRATPAGLPRPRPHTMHDHTTKAVATLESEAPLIVTLEAETIPTKALATLENVETLDIN